MNIDDTIVDAGDALRIGLDFNVGIMAGSIGGIADGEYHQFEEIAIPH